MGITEWVLKMIWNRLRGLGVSQFEDLIQHADSVESLQIIRNHLESGDFKYALVAVKAKELLALCDARAEYLLLKQRLIDIKPAATDLIELLKELL